VINLARPATKIPVFESATELVGLNLKNMSSTGMISPPPPIPAAFDNVMTAPRNSNPKNSNA